ncbi:TorF family putative porin [Parerythrobacter lacustris]|uniref:TorF family putative porin n=1 Tax=Parerythrobacter lacustris TaxID=2969984 RepID=A0ABT1XU90_9SPHN|nr:TorF family putative porin [Parerythrobacter lacustris]MCR2834809.1 TorF family putative porin [Parerythrobacter lacustris]
MLTSIRGIRAATFLAGSAFFATPAFAADLTDESAEASAVEIADVDITDIVLQDVKVGALEAAELSREAEASGVLRVSTPVSVADESALGAESGIEISGNVALVSDYRFRGVSFSDGDPALQGGIDLAHSSGLYVGTWASSISGGTAFGEVELDVYAGWSGDLADGLTFDVGLLYYIYPTGDVAGSETDYFEPYASIGTTLGPVGATLGVAYAWEQDSLGGNDNFYVYTDFEVGIPETPLTLTAHLGYSDGVFATTASGDSFDWGLGASYAITDSLSLGVNYVDTEGPGIEDFTDAGFFFTLGYSM